LTLHTPNSPGNSPGIN